MHFLVLIVTPLLPRFSNLWGKLSQKENNKNVMCDAAAFHKAMARHSKGNIRLTCCEVDPYLDDTFALTYEEMEYPSEITRCKTNVAIGVSRSLFILSCTHLLLIFYLFTFSQAHVTAYARLELYKILGDPALEDKCLYCDTDSVFLAVDKDYRHPLEGAYLGDWECEGTFDEFVCLSPKVYCLRDSATGAEKLKCKGFKLTNSARAKIGFNSLRASQTEGEDAPDLTVAYNHFRRQKYGWVYVGTMNKTLTYDISRQKSKHTGADNMYIPYGDHTDRPTPTPKKRSRPCEQPLPPVEHEREALRRRLPDEPESLDHQLIAEMSEAQSEDLMAATIAAQDRTRVQFFEHVTHNTNNSTST